MKEMEEHEVYSALGDDGFTRLTAAFYGQIPEDDILGPLYQQHDLAGAEQRLRDFLIYRFGGPPRYIETRGHPRLRMRHARFPVDAAASHRWVELMTKALDIAALPPEPAAILHRFFASTADFLINQPGA